MENTESTEMLNAVPVEKEVVDFVQNNIRSEKEFFEMVEFFKLFSDFTRLKVLFVLSMSEMCVSDIALVLKMHQSTISHQLKTLRASGMVRCRRVGKVIYYFLDDEHVGQVIVQGLYHIGSGI